MARGALLNIACHTARSQSCYGDTVLGWLFWAERATQSSAAYGAVKAPSSLGLRCLMRHCLPPNPCGKCPAYPTVPWADWPAPCPKLLCFSTSITALVAVPLQGQKSQHSPGPQAQGEQLGSSGCRCHSEMSHQPPTTHTGVNRHSIPLPPLHWE